MYIYVRGQLKKDVKFCNSLLMFLYKGLIFQHYLHQEQCTSPGSASILLNHFLKKSADLFMSHVFAACFTSLVLLKWTPFNCSLRFGNKKKSDGPKSEL